MLNHSASLAVCIPTFKRSSLLPRLIGDLSQQTRQPELLVIVDGAPAPRELLKALRSLDFPDFLNVAYVPSNHANLPYQRYLGWRASGECEWLLYLDDDLRILQGDFIENLVAPLTWPSQDIVGVTSEISFPNRTESPFEGALADRIVHARSKSPLLVSLFGSARTVPPGGLTPSGHRKPPVNRGKDYEPVEWLRGGVMACRRAALSADCFPDALLASYHAACGHGEDTLLSRRLQRKGRLLYAFCARAEHPDCALPMAYPTDGFGLGFVTACSRRLLNDYYRGEPPPRPADRLDLVKSYAGNLFLNWSRALCFPRRHRWAYAWGYTLGAAKALSRKPTARNLAPDIDWRAEAEEALEKAIFVSTATVCSR